MTSRSIAPSQLLQSQAASLNEQLGHENLGFLSDRCGLVPAEPPLTAMPLSHRDWDEIAADLPVLFRTLSVRDALDHMPVLHAGEDHLADRYLCRAAAVLSILAHSYVRSQPAVPATLPGSIRAPWEDVTRRLRRPMPFLSYIDLIVYNWRLRDADLADPMRVENLDLLLPTVGNEEERIFYLTQVEILAQSSVAISAMTRAQTAALNHDTEGLIQELLRIHERLQHISEVSFQKISPNPASSSYVDPVVWAKTVAPFAVPIDPDAAGPSGTASPLFHVLDLFFGRPGYESLLGHEMLKLRGWYPKHWTDFLGALGQVSISEFVRRAVTGSSRVCSSWHSIRTRPTKGFLGTHRLKVYGYLEMAFKVGRSVTIGGFKGLFQDRTWNEIDGELALSKAERLTGAPPQTVLGLPHHGNLPDASRGAATPVTFDLEDAGVQYRPGDRCGVLPENDEVMVARALDTLRASGDERVALDHHWREAIQHRHGFEGVGDLPLRILLRFGRLRPVSRDVARRLYALTANSRLRRIINARTEDQWDVPSLLQLLSEGGFDPRRLWRAEPWESDSICRIVPPEDVRLYSISSAMSPDERVSARRIDLTVASLSYETDDSDLSPPGHHHGTSSQFLRQAVDRSAGNARPVSLQIVPAPRFHLPTDVTRPIVMFAGGAGIAPFRSFMQDRARRTDAGANWLFYGVREPAHLNYLDEIESWIGTGQLHLQVAFSAADIELRFDPNTGSLAQETGRRRRLNVLIEDEEQAGSLWDLMQSVEDGGQGAFIYICGRAEFASSILASLRAIVARVSSISDEGQAQSFAETAIARMTAQGRLMQDVFTSYSRSYQVVPSADRRVRTGAAERRRARLLDGCQRSSLRPDQLRELASRRATHHPSIRGNRRDRCLSGRSAPPQSGGGRATRAVRDRRHSPTRLRHRLGRRDRRAGAVPCHARRCVPSMGQPAFPGRRDGKCALQRRRVPPAVADHRRRRLAADAAEDTTGARHASRTSSRAISAASLAPTCSGSGQSRPGYAVAISTFGHCAMRWSGSRPAMMRKPHARYLTRLDVPRSTGVGPTTASTSFASCAIYWCVTTSGSCQH